MIRLASFSACRSADAVSVSVSSYWILDPPGGPYRVHEYALPNSVERIPADVSRSKPWVELSAHTGGSGTSATFHVEGKGTGVLSSSEDVYRRHVAGTVEKQAEARGVQFPGRATGR